MSGFIAAADPASKVAYQFTDVDTLAVAIRDLGYIPLAPDGSPLLVQQFEGGYLLQGAPINVWMGKGWYSGQRELLEPYWQAGTIPTPPASITGAQVVAMPADVAADYAAYKAQDAGLFGGISTPMLLAAGAVALFFFTGTGKGKRKSIPAGSQSFDY